VEHVHVHEGGQAIVGCRGDGSHRKRRNNPVHLPTHQAPRCRARTRRDSPCQSLAMKNGRCRMHGRPSPGAPKGNKNALKQSPCSKPLTSGVLFEIASGALANASSRRRSKRGLSAAAKDLSEVQAAKHNPGRGSTYRRGNSGQTTAATSLPPAV
jgi:hypothetical protein